MVFMRALVHCCLNNRYLYEQNAPSLLPLDYFRLRAILGGGGYCSCSIHNGTLSLPNHFQPILILHTLFFSLHLSWKYWYIVFYTKKIQLLFIGLLYICVKFIVLSAFAFFNGNVCKCSSTLLLLLFSMRIKGCVYKCWCMHTFMKVPSKSNRHS